MQAYETALTGTPERVAIGARGVKPGTINDLVSKYFASAAFLGLPSEATRATYRGIIEGIRKEHGDKRVAHLRPDHVESLFTKKIATPAAANNWLRMLRMLMQFAISKRMIAIDPTTGIKTLKYESEGFYTWTEDDIAAYYRRHPIGSMARLAMTLMLYTGCRRADAVLLGPQNVKQGVITYTQQKNRIRKPVTLTIPLHPELKAVIDATPTVGLKTFLVTSFGKPFSKAGFGNYMRDRCDEAGLPECSGHGLRKAITRRLAEAGVSTKVMASITGHRTLKELERYSEKARQALMAEIGMRSLDNPAPPLTLIEHQK